MTTQVKVFLDTNTLASVVIRKQQAKAAQVRADKRALQMADRLTPTEIVGVGMKCPCGEWELQVGLDVDIAMMQEAIRVHGRGCAELAKDAFVALDPG